MAADYDQHPRAPEPLHILADDREQEAGVIAALRRMDGVVVAIHRLSLGDYEVASTLIVERKIFIDFTASIKDGRLFTQARRLARASLPTLLILEGTAAAPATTAMRREAVQGALISLSLIFGIPVLRSLSADETARLIVYAARQLRHTVQGAIPRHGYRPKGKRKRQLHILQGLPGIGPARAARLLDTFGTVQAVINADPDRWSAVPGIGRRIADAMTWAAREAQATYADGNEPYLP